MVRVKRSGGKYHAKKTVVDGITFDSKKESLHYLDLKQLLKVGMIKSFTCQPRFLLQEGYRRKDGKKIRKIEYVADFRVVHLDDRVVIEDVKSKATEKIPTFLIKRKMLELKYPDINFEIVL